MLSRIVLQFPKIKINCKHSDNTVKLVSNRIYVIDNNVRYVEYIESQKMINIVYNNNHSEYIYDEDPVEDKEVIKPIFDIIEKALKKDAKTIVLEDLNQN